MSERSKWVREASRREAMNNLGWGIYDTQLCPRKDIYDTQLTCYQDTLDNSDKAKKILTCITYLYVIHVSIFFGTRTEYRSRYNECLST
jgi:hypothetical protein